MRPARSRRRPRVGEIHMTTTATASSTTLRARALAAFEKQQAEEAERDRQSKSNMRVAFEKRVRERCLEVFEAEPAGMLIEETTDGEPFLFIAKFSVDGIQFEASHRYGGLAIFLMEPCDKCGKFVAHYGTVSSLECLGHALSRNEPLICDECRRPEKQPQPTPQPTAAERLVELIREIAAEGGAS